MDAAQTDHVWHLLDRGALAERVQRDRTVLFATLSGAHLYGFPSPDSDVDLRGAFLLPLRRFAGLSDPEETWTLADRVGGRELDGVLHEARKFVRLALRNDGYALEQLYSPLVVVGGPLLEELRSIARGCVTRRLVHHYRGFARGRLERLRGPEPTVKDLLYAYRVLLTGIHVLRTGEVQSNLPVLLEHHELPGVQGMLERKRTGAERSPLTATEVGSHGDRLDTLAVALDAAHAASTLPEDPTAREALSAWLDRLPRPFDR